MRFAPTAAALLAATCLAAPGFADTGRLPAGVTPSHYDISVDPDAARMSFTGSETIDIQVDQPTATIVLNAAELKIGAVTLDGATRPVTVATDENAQTLTLIFAKPVAAGAHRLAIAYTGKIHDAASGMFASDYDGVGGKQRMIVTQFEASDARRFAPMWDEPAIKATFTLTATAPGGQLIVSNMPAAKTAKRADGKTIVTFQPTPRMSTYLLFMAEGDLERRTAMAGKTEIGIVTRRGVLDQGDYSLASAARILSYYNDYFGTPYPLPKLDMIAAPGSSQFFSAMENWGAILYFDRAVLLDPKRSSESDRQNIFNTVAHEMAHQWFGDLVTMSWWDDLWLNEGYASWMASKVSNDLNPEWNVAAQTAAFARQAAFTTDAQSSTHPIIRHIETVDQVAQAFDTITYLKGEAVIGMLEASVGPDTFRAGVRSYMAKHAYHNTVTDDLWAEVGAAAKRPVKPFMDSFTLQGGVPLIRAGEPACAGGKTSLTLSQDRFGVDAASRKPQTWLVPVDVSTGTARSQTLVSGPAQQPASVAGCGTVVIDPGQQGYYRVLPSPNHFARLAADVAKLPLVDQVGLLNDTLSLANGDYAGLDRYFGLLDHLPANADPLIWDLVGTQLVGIDTIFDGDPVRPAFRARARKLLSGRFASVGFTAKPGEAPAVGLLREELIIALGLFGDPQVVDSARKYVAAGLDTIPASIRSPVLRVYAYNATPADWDQLHAIVKAEKDPGSQDDIYSVLGAAADPALARRTLDLALAGESTTSNRASMISGVARSQPALAFDWATAHVAQVNALLEETSRPGYIVGLATRSSDAAAADRVQAYAEKAIAPSARQTANTVIARIRYSARLRAEQAAPVRAWASR